MHDFDPRSDGRRQSRAHVWFVGDLAKRGDHVAVARSAPRREDGGHRHSDRADPGQLGRVSAARRQSHRPAWTAAAIPLRCSCSRRFFAGPGGRSPCSGIPNNVTRGRSATRAWRPRRLVIRVVEGGTRRAERRVQGSIATDRTGCSSSPIPAVERARASSSRAEKLPAIYESGSSSRRAASSRMGRTPTSCCAGPQSTSTRF